MEWLCSPKESLLGVQYAPAQRLRLMIFDAIEHCDGNPLGDWLIQGVFENGNQYNGPLSGVGIKLVLSNHGLFNLRVLSDFKPLVPEAYIALSAMQCNQQALDKPIQPWTRWIKFALESNPLMSLKDADDAWLELTFYEQHCCNIVADDPAAFALARTSHHGGC